MEGVAGRPRPWSGEGGDREDQPARVGRPDDGSPRGVLADKEGGSSAASSSPALGAHTGEGPLAGDGSVPLAYGGRGPAEGQGDLGVVHPERRLPPSAPARRRADKGGGERSRVSSLVRFVVSC